MGKLPVTPVQAGQGRCAVVGLRPVNAVRYHLPLRAQTGSPAVNKILLVAEATFDRAAPHIGGVAAGMSAALVLGVVILNLGLPGWLTVVLIVALLVGLALLKARFGPCEMRVETFDDEAGARIAGRFANATVSDKASRDVDTAVIEANGDLRIDLADEGEPASLYLRQPAFKGVSLSMLADVINDLTHRSRAEMQERYDRSHNELKVYNAKNMFLMRYTERPSYMAMMWLVSAITVLFWLALLPAFMGG